MPFELPTSGDITVNATFYDEAQNSTYRSITIPWDTDLATTLANAIDVLDDLYPATDAQVMATVRLSLVQNPIVPAQAGSEVENCAAVTCTLVTDATHKTPYHTVEIPAPKIGMFVGTTGPNKNVVNTAAAILVNFLSHFEVGEQAVLSDFQNIASIDSGKRVHKRSRKG